LAAEDFHHRLPHSFICRQQLVSSSVGVEELRW
jgi:hypothetical protein